MQALFTMMSLKFVFLIALLVTLGTRSLSTAEEDGQKLMHGDEQEGETSSSLRGISRFLAWKPRATMTCNNYPRVCRAKGSPGPDCCKKKCVNVFTDRLNCGKCGSKCKYSQVCCKGKCVNPLADKNNCGGCSNKCKSGNKCVYGMCSYA